MQFQRAWRWAAGLATGSLIGCNAILGDSEFAKVDDEDAMQIDAGIDASKTDVDTSVPSDSIAIDASIDARTDASMETPFDVLVDGPGKDVYGTNFYTTNFPSTENPISQGSRWWNGKTDGIDWWDVRTSKGSAYGARAAMYPDTSTNSCLAVLKGTWGPDQAVTATVHTINDGIGTEYVSVLLRATLAAHTFSGYSAYFSLDDPAEIGIQRWTSASIDTLVFTRVPVLKNGDVVKAVVAENTITAYINGTMILSADDPTFVSGNPGMEFSTFVGSLSSQSDFGFSSFTATDGPP